MKPIEHLTSKEIGSRPLLAKKVNDMLDCVTWLLGVASGTVERMDQFEQRIERLERRTKEPDSAGDSDKAY